MKIKLYVGNENTVKLSGIGKAFYHQQKALELNNIEYTTYNKDKDFDLVHINTPFINSYFEAKRAKRLGKKVIMHAHSTEEDFKNSFMFSNTLAPLYKKWLIKLYNQGDHIITPTPYSKKLLESYGIDIPITPISNGIDLGRFKNSRENEYQFVEKFKISPEDKLVISVGWVFERKGFDTFVEVASNFPDVKFIWFGDVEKSAPTGNILKILKNLPDNVLMAGYVDSLTLIGAYSRCDVFFFPSREETEGIVVLEALACRCKNVLLRDIPVFDGWMKGGVNCHMGNDSNDFISLINDIVYNESNSLANAGYEVASQRNIKEVGKQLIAVYHETLNR
ncbi:MAG: glycosyltransferase [Erysipelotrichaceae bacterium]|nr:glycosyltransferase [Erysipelotrichaceae bacterium]